MKKLNVLMVILPLFTIACSEEYTGEIIETAQIKETVHTAKSAKRSGIGPANGANPFDIGGSIHNEILETLDQTNFNLQSIGEIAILIDSVAAVYPAIISLSNEAPLSSRLSEITSIVNSNSAIDEVLTASTLSLNAKASLLTFANSLLLVAVDDPYEDIHSMIVSYEADVLINSTFTNNDKRIILTTTSVARYSIYVEKRKDKDWETGASRIAATVSGAEHGVILALKMALTIELCQNNNITQ